jgi:flagellar L-ring protein precursor FlgH
MLKQVIRTATLSVVIAVAGCATPTSVIKEPITARPPQPQAQSQAANGTIFQVSRYRPMFEDRRARFVGDILTIAINEKTNAGKDASSKASKTGSATASIPSVVKLLLKPLQGTNLSATSDNKYEDKSTVTSGNNFTGSITVTVVEVLPNGNMVVGGEKQVALDKETEYVRFSGVVSPDTIITGNVVSSTQVADARIEYRTSSHIDSAEVTNWLARFFLSVIAL